MATNKVVVCWQHTQFPKPSSILQQITVAAQSKALTVFARSNTGIVVSDPIQDMDVCVGVFCVYVVLCVGRGLATADLPSKESYRLCKILLHVWNLEEILSWKR
jgi:hypothetical protein